MDLYTEIETLNIIHNKLLLFFLSDRKLLLSDLLNLVKMMASVDLFFMYINI